MVFCVETQQTDGMLNIADLSGLWTRSLMAWPDGRRDTETEVGWLQGMTAYADLRQKPGHAGHLQHVRCLQDLTMGDCERLATQQAFAGTFLSHGESFEWVRSIDFQPPRAGGDVGLLYWQGDILVEEGLQGDYIEHWHRDPLGLLSPCAALTLKGKDAPCWGSVVRVGNMFAYARDRQVKLVGDSLAACIAGAANIEAARALVDFEISMGVISDDVWRITRSTLPFRVDSVFTQILQGETHSSMADLAPGGEAMTRDWEIVASEGDTSVFFDGNS
jgi:hypothetical protein